MDDDQQFCLRWNNHQSTLISVFDNLLENETLVDCTLAAEGKFLKAHKVVLSACSPYFASLLQEQYDKHPIFILKDVKYQELRAMMDYMYRGEVNISQDQLAALLKAAESLQIKGLSDNRTGAPKHDHHRGLNLPSSMSGGKLSGGYTLEQTKRARVGPSAMDSQDMSGSREGSSSPTRRRRKVRRRSIENAMTEIHDSSNSSQMQSNQSALLQQPANLTGVGAITAAASALTSQIPTSSTGLSTGANAGATGATSGLGSSQQQTTNVTKKTESVKGTSDAMNTENVQTGNIAGIDDQDMEHMKGEKQNHKQKMTATVASAKDTSDLVIEPKSEYDDEGNDEAVEDLTLDEEEMGMDDLDHNAGTSQGGEGSSQGYAPWQQDRSQDELLMTTQDAQQRDPQDLRTLYSIATAAAAVVAAASAQTLTTSTVPIHTTPSSTTLIADVTSNSPKSSQNTIKIASTSAGNLSTANSISAPINNTPSSTPTLNPISDIFEPEITIRKMYKCCSHSGSNSSSSNSGNTRQTQKRAATPPLSQNVGSNSSSNNCSGCHMSAAASFQLANLINSTMLLPQAAAAAAAMQNVAKNVAAAKCNATNSAAAQQMPAQITQLNAVSTTKKLSAITAGLCSNSCSSSNNNNNVATNLANNVAGASSNTLSGTTAMTATSIAATATAIATTTNPQQKKVNAYFHCEFCAFSCSWRYDLKLHLRQKHGIHNKKM